jgi:hypothetical protein
MPIRAPKSSSAAALVGIWAILLVVFVITVLYVTRGWLRILEQSRHTHSDLSATVYLASKL